VRSDDDDLRLWCCTMNLGHTIKAVAVGQIEVKENQVGLEPPAKAEALATVRCLLQTNLGEIIPANPDDEAAHHNLILYDYDFQGVRKDVRILRQDT
jgi:hypothetical protein